MKYFEILAEDHPKGDYSIQIYRNLTARMAFRD
jgi:hypothetical protein